MIVRGKASTINLVELIYTFTHRRNVHSSVVFRFDAVVIFVALIRRFGYD